MREPVAFLEFLGDIFLALQKRKSGLLALLQISLGAETREPPNPGNVARPLRHRDRAAGIQEIKKMRALDAVIVGREDQPFRDQRPGFFFGALERLFKRFDACLFEIKPGKLNFPFVMNLSVFHRVVPSEVVDIIDLLKIHRHPLESIGDLDRDRIERNSADLLEIGELRDLHSIQPDLPAEPPGAERRRLPVVLNKADVVLLHPDAERRETLKIELLNIVGCRFEDYLILIIVLEPVGVFAVAAVGGTAGGLDIGGVPWLRAEGAKESRRMKRPGADFIIIRLKNQTALFGPILMEG